MNKNCPCGGFYLFSAGEDGMAMCIDCGSTITKEELEERGMVQDKVQ
jgi:uncharacterized Zn finger protein (UPF0148 family)